MNTTFKIISIIVILLIIGVGFQIYNFFYPIKFVQRSKIKTEFIDIGNPLGDTHYYFEVKKYLYSKKKNALGWGGGSSYWQTYYGTGLASANKKILIKPVEGASYDFIKIKGFNTNNQLDSIFLIEAKQFNKFSLNSKYLMLDGTPFNADNKFLNNVVMLSKYNDKNRGFVYQLKENRHISKFYSIWWFDNKTLIVRDYKYDKNLQTSITPYGAIAIDGKIIVPINKKSKEEVIQQLKK